MKTRKLKWWVKPILIGTPIITIATILVIERMTSLVEAGY